MTTPYTIPEGFDVIDAPGSLTIRRTWLTWKIAPLILFVIFWDGFLIFWYTMALGKAHAPLMMILFPLIHVAVGVSLTYFVIASFFNKTDIIIAPTNVRVATGPLPWIGNCEIRREDVSSILVRERSGNRGRISYEVMYADRARKERKLVGYITQSEQARFIAARVRQIFGLVTTDE
jgi:hypothetical protein